MRRRSFAPHFPFAFVTAFAALAGVAGPGCKDKAPPPPQGTPKVGPEPSASTSASGSSDTAKKAAPGTLQVVAARDGRITLGVFDDGTVYASAGLALAIARDGGELTRETKWLSGMPEAAFGGGWAVDDVTFGGRFPEDAWVTQSTQYLRGSSNWGIYHWLDEKWANVKNEDGKLLWYYASYATWTDGATLALRLHDMPAMGEDEPGQAALEKLVEKSVPTFEVPGKKVDSLPIFSAGARPSTFAATRTGEVIAVFDVGSYDAPETKVQRWAAGDTKGVVEQLPGVSKSIYRPVLTMTSATSAWLGGGVEAKAYLAHFDGKAWSKVDTTKDLAAKGDVVSVAEAVDGTVWVVTAPDPDDKGDVGLGELWKRANGATSFARVNLASLKFPEDGRDRLDLVSASGPVDWDLVKGDAKDAATEWFLGPRQVVVGKDGEPFVAALTSDDPKTSPFNGYAMSPAEGRWLVLRLKPASARLQLPKREMVSVELEDLTDAPVASAAKVSRDCSSFFVAAGDVPAGAAADWDPADLRAALKDRIGPPSGASADVYEVKMQGRRRVGVFLPMCSGDDCVKWVDDLVAALTKKLPAAPKLYCRVPFATRLLDVHFAPAK